MRTMSYGESSKIVTLFTRDFGKISLLARGARAMKSKFGGALELFTYNSIVFYEKEGRELQYLSDVAISEGFMNIRNDISRTYMALVMLELCNKAIHGSEENQDLFRLLIKALEALNEARDNFMNVLLFFAYYVAKVLGYDLNISSCDNCSDMLERAPLYLNLDQGRFVCRQCPQNIRLLNSDYAISRDGLAFLRRIVKSRVATVCEVPSNKTLAAKSFFVILAHLRFHIGEVRELKSLGLH